LKLFAQQVNYSVKYSNSLHRFSKTTSISINKIKTNSCARNYSDRFINNSFKPPNNPKLAP
jgi:hypothetical protein